MRKSRTLGRVGRATVAIATVYTAGRAFETGWHFADPGHPYHRWASRIGHVALGRPIIYGLHYWNGAIVEPQHLRIEDCQMEGSRFLPAIEIVPQGARSTAQTRLLRRLSRRVLLEQQRVRTARKPALP